MLLWSDTCIHLDTDIKALFLFDTHHAALVHHCSAPWGSCWKKLTFAFSFLLKLGSTQADKSRSLSAPMSIYFFCSKFEKTLNRLQRRGTTEYCRGFFSCYKCQIFYLILKVWAKQTSINRLCVSGNELAVVQGRVFPLDCWLAVHRHLCVNTGQTKAGKQQLQPI